MNILQINTSVNTGSTGRIAEDIGRLLIENGHNSTIAYGRGNRPSHSSLIKIGSKKDILFHGLKTVLFDLHGFGSKKATVELIQRIENLKPDVIGLHNLHGYYINIEILFKYLRKVNIPVVWTLHDCWSFTGHCSYFDRYSCEKWKVSCFSCPNKRGYPSSWFADNSRNNCLCKRNLFTQLENLTIVSPSVWLANHVKNSFLRNYPVKVINNGVDLNNFYPSHSEEIRRKYHLGLNRFILGVANIWDKRKGFEDFIQLRKVLDPDFKIVLAGLSKKQIANIPVGITGIERTENIRDLASLYSEADIFVNPTYVDNFPTINLEALACGTPVITYNTGGSPEAIDDKTGLIVEKGDISVLAKAVRTISDNGKNAYSNACRERAEKLFDKNARYNDYLELYKTLL